MVKIPELAEHSSDPDAIARRTQILHDLGLLVFQWNRIELYTELAIKRITGLSNLHCSIMLGGLMHKAKISILYGLLREEGKVDAIAKLSAAMSFAKRNALMHGNLGSNDQGKFVFYHRSVDKKYVVKSTEFEVEPFHQHVWEFCSLADEAIISLGIDHLDPEIEKELRNYAIDARFEGIES